MSEKELPHIRHSLAHLMVAAMKELYPGAKNAIGPAIDDGFYQDFDLPKPISEADLPKIEEKMREMLPKWTEWTGKTVTLDEVRKEFSWNEYKIELAEEFSKEGKDLTFYTCSGLVDLCKGGHAVALSEIDPDSFKLDRLAGAYWRGNEKNKMLTRIYGLAFNTKEELENHIKLREEAEKRDHKKLGKELGLYMFHETAPGMPYWLPKGLILYKELENYWRKEHVKFNYMEIASPLVNKAELWKTSGHWDYYKDDMFIADMGENELYGIKPMNCPNAMIVFKSMQVSYKNLPLRLSDTDRLHRYERSGVLNGLL